MAHAIHGKGAVIYLAPDTVTAASAVGEQISWSLDFDMALVDTTPLNTSWKEFVKGIKGWTGTFAGNFDVGNKQLWNASLEDSAVNFYLYPNWSNDPTQFYSGTVWVQLSKIAEGSTTTKASSGWKATGDGALSLAP